MFNEFKYVVKRLIFLIPLFLCSNCSPQDNSARQCPSIEVRFSPKGGITESIVNGIGRGKDHIYVNAFSFTSKPIAKALIEAKENGRNVEVILDKNNINNPDSVIHSLYQADIPIYIDDRHGLAHNKVIVIDNVEVFTGSFNLSRSAEDSNSENNISIHDQITVGLYIDNFNLHKNHSKPYTE